MGHPTPIEKPVTNKNMIKDAERTLKQMNREYESIKMRRFQVRRGRNSRIFVKSMNKTIFDYDTDGSTQEESKSAKLGYKRNWN